MRELLVRGCSTHLADSEFILNEIVKCIELAKDGIHAVLVVLSVQTRFSKEEATALHSLKTLFGSQICDYMIVVFTGGYILEEDDETLEDYLGHKCPEPLKEFLGLCENRSVLFDNKTKGELKRVRQVHELLSLVNLVITQNGGQPYTDEIFTELKLGTIKLHDQHKIINSLEGYSKQEISWLKYQLNRSHEEQLKRITEMVESKLRETTTRLEQQLAKERAARLKGEKSAQHAQMEANDEIRKLRENLENVQRETEELRKSTATKQAEKRCLIL